MSAQRVEWTRQWLKETVRNNLPNEVGKNLDTAYHNLTNTQNLIERIAVQYEQLMNKTEKKWLLRKAWGAVWEALDFVSGGFLRWVVSKLIPRNAWYKTMNSIDIEISLKKLLKDINKINKKKAIKEWDIKKIIDDFEKWIKASLRTDEPFTINT